MDRRKFLGFVGMGATTGMMSPRLGNPSLAQGTTGESASPRPAPDSLSNSPAYSFMDPWIEVQKDHIAYNLAQVRTLAKVPVMAVIKANAYGHGLAGYARCLEQAGVEWLMVGKLQEALALRQAGIKTPILNYGPFAKEDAPALVQADISQAVFDSSALYLQEAAIEHNKKAGMHVVLDTGMGRMGIIYSKALALIKKLRARPGLVIQGLSTTLTEDKEFDVEQVRRLYKVHAAAAAEGIDAGLRHAASSGGILASPSLHLDMVRPGIMLYGYYPSADTQKDDRLSLKPVLKLSARITAARSLESGDTLSYHRVFKAQRRMRVATAGIGYSDGYPHRAAGKAFAQVKGIRCPVIAAVTSNHTMVDITEVRDARIGDEVTLIDPDRSRRLSAELLEEWSGDSVYKLLIHLNPLLPRKYV